MPIIDELKAHWHEWYDFLHEVWESFTEDQISLAAGGIAFFALLSIIPLLLLALSVAAFFVTPGQAQSQIEQMITQSLGRNISGSFTGEILPAVHSFVTHRGLFTGVALLGGIWSGSQIFLILESAVNLAWHSRRRRPFWLSRGLAMLMVIIVGLLMTFAILLANLMRVLASFEVSLGGHLVSEAPWLVSFMISIVIPTLLMTAVFTVIYRVLPTKRVTLRTVIPGAVFAGVLWAIALQLFSWYTVKFLIKFTALIPPLGGLFPLLLWFYYTAFTLLLGAEISAVYHQRLLRQGDKYERLVERITKL